MHRAHLIFRLAGAPDRVHDRGELFRGALGLLRLLVEMDEAFAEEVLGDEVPQAVLE